MLKPRFLSTRFGVIRQLPLCAKLEYCYTENMVSVKCGHSFHAECYQQATSNDCVQCKANLQLFHQWVDVLLCMSLFLRLHNIIIIIIISCDTISS